MFKELILKTKKVKWSDETRKEYVQANEFVVFIKHQPKFKFKLRGMSWIQFEYDATSGEWIREPGTKKKLFNGAEVLDSLIDAGWEVTSAKRLS